MIAPPWNRNCTPTLEPVVNTELLQLRQEQRGDDGRDQVSGAAEQRRAAQHHGGDRGHQVAVALERARQLHQPGKENAAQAVERRRAGVGRKLVAAGATPAARAARGLAPTASNTRRTRSS